MFKIAVIGTGYVGLTTGIGLANFGCSILCMDIQEDKISNLNKGIMPFYEPGMEEALKVNMACNRLNFSTKIAEGIEWAEVVFIAVGTPQGIKGKADLSAVMNVAELIGKSLNGYKIIVTKSTVPVGTNEKIKEVISSFNTKKHDFDIVSNPEFLREGRALYDFYHPDRVVVGTDNPRPVETIRRIYRPLYLNEIPFVFTDIRTSELIKYSCNSFLAMKVAFINEISRLCDAVGADVSKIAYAMGKDGRIGGKFLHPGPGFGGSCFPKDTEAMKMFAEEVNVDVSIINAIIQSNNTQKEYMVEKIKKRFARLKGIQLGILGLAFKSETDDIRESPAVFVVKRLIEEGAVLRVYDPQATENAKLVLGEKVFYAINEYDAIINADGLVILTEWNQFRNLDLLKIASLMRGKMFFDYRNIYDMAEVENSSLIYEGIGR
ncbi:MAG: UDP-glucose/GDP-mannose dehydrogenase family protein [Clostridia bacterium]|nr:UDP-glucose/GDP-mannose dehydrogenase family protein [Clostridia bacterium]